MLSTPGHTARYCVYTLMEETQKLVVDFEVVDKPETGGKSATMEKLALSRLLQRLKGVLKRPSCDRCIYINHGIGVRFTTFY